jgi:hypothetical protein
MSVQDLEVTMATERTDLMLYRVALYRALGGTWTDTLTDPSADSAVRTAAVEGTVSSAISNTGTKR